METITLPRGLATLRALRLPRALGILERLYGAALAAHGVAWVRTSTGVAWKLDLADPCQRWVVYGDYEGRRQMDWLRCWLAGGGTVVDSGAHVGEMLLYLAALPGVRIVAFEPVPASVAWLRECLARQAGWNVEVVASALAARPGSVHMQQAGPHTTARLDWYPRRGNPRIQVPAVRLDDHLQAAGIERLRLWKLDVEGGELDALAGAQRLLGDARIDALLVEVSQQTRAGVAALMHGAGYRPFTIGLAGRLRPMRGDARVGSHNLLYLSGAAAGAAC